MSNAQISDAVRQELEKYREWIRKYRARQIGEIKMQKIRLQLGTYHQRQDGVQMQRIKFPGGMLSADQLIKLADVAEKYAGAFIHFTTRQDAQLYYVKLEDCPEMMADLASAGITTREACGNTVRNITASYQSGTDPSEPFDVRPYAEGLFRYLVRNKFNQVMGRKFKIAWEGTAEDYAGLRFHDFGFQAVVRKEGGKECRGFRTYIGGGLGAVPALGHLYSEFVPEEEILNLAAATLRIFDRHGERKNRMAARMKFLVRKLGWETFKALVDEERKKVKIPEKQLKEYLERARRAPAPPALPETVPAVPVGVAASADYKAWREDNVRDHKIPGYKGVTVRLRLGDITSEPARQLAAFAREFSNGEVRISIHQNLFLPWVPEKALPALYQKLKEIQLADAGAETLDDTTTCPGADTCRLGITSAKGLGANISSAAGNGLQKYKNLFRDVKIKVSGCPNGCAQHGIANIGFQGAALSKDGKTVPAHEVFVGGGMDGDNTTFGERIGKIPARNGSKVVEALLGLYAQEKQENESFNQCMKRIGKDRVRETLASLMEIPSFEEKPEFYKDWGHENEKFAVRTGIKGECAGAPVQEKAPLISDAKERLAQAEAFLKHKEFENAQIEAYEAMAAGARFPLYANLVDPFTSEQALWEFENLFVRGGRASSEWMDLSERLEAEKKTAPNETRARKLIDDARKFLAECERLQQELSRPNPPKV